MKEEEEDIVGMCVRGWGSPGLLRLRETPRRDRAKLAAAIVLPSPIHANSSFGDIFRYDRGFSSWSQSPTYLGLLSYRFFALISGMA